MYLGEHYFTDVVAGIIYATASFILVEWGLKKISYLIPDKVLQNRYVGLLYR